MGKALITQAMQIKILTSSLLAKNDVDGVRDVCAHFHSADIAEALCRLTTLEAIKLIRFLPISLTADIFSHLDNQIQKSVVQAFTSSELEVLIKEINADQLVDVIDEMPANLVKKILHLCPSKLREKVNTLMQYQEDTAGSIMMVNFVELKGWWSVQDAIKEVKQKHQAERMPDTFYVVDQQHRMIGLISLKKLFFSPYEQKISDLCASTSIVSVFTYDDQEQVAFVVQKYDLEAIPVLNQQHRLVGIITVDQVVDVVEQEATEDIQKLSGISPTEKAYFATSVIKMVRARSMWLLFLMISATVSQLVISGFFSLYGVVQHHNTYSAITYIVTALLVPVLPLVSGTSGNAGSQSATMVIRALSLRQVDIKDYWKVMWKELRVGFVCGFILVAANFIRMIAIYFIQTPHTINTDKWLSIAVLSIALYLTLIIAKLVGSMLPIIATWVKLDPAIMAAPLLTTLVDALSTAIFFSIGFIFYLPYIQQH